MRISKTFLLLVAVLLLGSSLLAEITEVGSIRTSRSTWDLCVDGDYAYIPDYYYGLKIYDVTDPSAPTVVATIADYRYRYIREVVKRDDYIFTMDTWARCDPMMYPIRLPQAF